MSVAEDDPRLARGAILLVEDNPLVRTTMVMMLRKPALVGHKFVVIDAGSVKEMKERLAQRLTEGERRELPRPPICGFFVDYELEGETALHVLEDLDERYPFTPGAMYTGGDAAECMIAAATARQMRYLQKPFGAEQLRMVIEQLFLPHDQERLAFRRFLIELTAVRFGRVDPMDLPEHLMRVAEARALEDLDKKQGALAHGVKESTLETYFHELKERLGMPLERARKEFRRSRYGRSASGTFRLAQQAQATPTQHAETGDAPGTPAHDGAPPARRPSALRGRKGRGPDRVH